MSAAPAVSTPSEPAPVRVPPDATAAAQEDPYPGFTQLPSGEWVAKDQQAYERWMAWQEHQRAGLVAEGFDEKDLARRGGAIVDVDEAAQRARDAWNSRPGAAAAAPLGKAEGHKPAAAVKGVRVSFSTRCSLSLSLSLPFGSRSLMVFVPPRSRVS